MNYKIEKIKSTSKEFEVLAGMEVLTFISPVTKEKNIDGPINLCDYDKYYEWLRKETNKYNISISDNLEDFKEEFMSDPGQFIPLIQDDSLEYVKMATMLDISAYNSNYKYYFEKQLQEEPCK